MKLFTIPFKILNFRLFLFIAVSLCLGITSACFFAVTKTFLGIVICCLFVLSLSAFLFVKVKDGKSLKAKSIFCLVFALAFVLGNLYFTAVINDYKRADLDGHYYSVTARIAEYNDTDVGNRALLDNVTIKGNRTGKLKYKAYLYVYGVNDLQVGDVISFYANFIDKDIIYEGNLSATDIVRGVKYMVELSAEDISVENHGVLTIFERVNLFIRDSLYTGLDENEFSLAYALLTGHDEFMDFDLISSYRNAGVAHVFAVSGLHIGFLALALGLLFDKLKVNRLIKAIAITVLLIFYSGVCGFSASSIRATIMVAVSLFLAVKGLRYDPVSSISLSAIIVLLLSPEQLFYVGFQLSFTVALGIVLLAKPISSLFKFLPKKLAQSLGTILSAQIAGIPICLLAFNQFSTIAILANLLFIPVVSVLYVALLILTITGGVFCIPEIALFVPNYLLKFVNMCIVAFDYSIFVVGGITLGGFAVLYYLVMLLLSDLINLKRLVKTISCLALSVIFVLGVATLNLNKANLVKVHVIGSERLCVTAISTRQENVLVVSKANKIYSASRLKRLKEQQGITHFDKVIILSGANNDEQVFLTKLYSVFTFETVYYFGEEKPYMEQIVSQSFKGAMLINATDGQKLVETFECSYQLNGVALNANLNQNNVAIFAQLNQNSFAGLTGEYDLTISLETPEIIGAYYQAKHCVGYRAYSAKIDAESQGTKTLCF